MRLYLAILHLRLAVAYAKRHHRRCDKAFHVGDFEGFYRHLRRAYRSGDRLERLMDRVNRLAPSLGQIVQPSAAE